MFLYFLHKVYYTYTSIYFRRICLIQTSYMYKYMLSQLMFFVQTLRACNLMVLPYTVVQSWNSTLDIFFLNPKQKDVKVYKKENKQLEDSFIICYKMLLLTYFKKVVYDWQYRFSHTIWLESVGGKFYCKPCQFPCPGTMTSHKWDIFQNQT